MHRLGWDDLERKTTFFFRKLGTYECIKRCTYTDRRACRSPNKSGSMYAKVISTSMLKMKWTLKSRLLAFFHFAKM